MPKYELAVTPNVDVGIRVMLSSDVVPADMRVHLGIDDELERLLLHPSPQHLPGEHMGYFTAHILRRTTLFGMGCLAPTAELTISKAYRCFVMPNAYNAITSGRDPHENTAAIISDYAAANNTIVMYGGWRTIDEFGTQLGLYHSPLKKHMCLYYRFPQAHDSYLLCTRAELLDTLGVEYIIGNTWNMLEHIKGWGL